MVKRETPTEARERQMARIQGEGVDAAIETLIGVCRDPKAAAPAKSSAGTALLRAGGLFEKRDADKDLQPHEMTPEQLSAAIARFGRDAEAVQRGEPVEAEEDEGGDEEGEGAGLFT